jgi:hypothetical protein
VFVIIGIPLWIPFMAAGGRLLAFLLLGGGAATRRSARHDVNVPSESTAAAVRRPEGLDPLSLRDEELLALCLGAYPTADCQTTDAGRGIRDRLGSSLGVRSRG